MTWIRFLEEAGIFAPHQHVCVPSCVQLQPEALSRVKLEESEADYSAVLNTEFKMHGAFPPRMRAYPWTSIQVKEQHSVT